MGISTTSALSLDTTHRWQSDQAVFDPGFSEQLQHVANTITDFKQVADGIIEKNDEQVSSALTLAAMHDMSVGLVAGVMVGSLGGVGSAVQHCNYALDGPYFSKASPCVLLHMAPYAVGGGIVGALTGRHVGSHQLATTDRSMARDVQIGAAAGLAVGAAVGLKGLHKYQGITSLPEMLTTAAAGTVVQAWLGAVVGSVSGLIARIAEIGD